MVLCAICGAVVGFVVGHRTYRVHELPVCACPELCRYLFVRCDNSPAPWTSDETGDSKRLDVPELAAKEIKQAQGQVFAMSDKPFW